MEPNGNEQLDDCFILKRFKMINPTRDKRVVHLCEQKHKLKVFRLNVRTNVGDEPICLWRQTAPHQRIGGLTHISKAISFSVLSQIRCTHVCSNRRLGFNSFELIEQLS